MKTVEARWRVALTFMTREPGWKRKLALGGLWILVFPPVGWIMALGYRSLTGSRLVEGTVPLLPSWRKNAVETVRRGVGAVRVILTYYIPFFVTYWLLATPLSAIPGHVPDVLLFFGLIVAFPPLFLPTLPVYFALRHDWVTVSTHEGVALLVLFLASTFVLPAAFTQVALEGRYAAAYRPMRAIRFVATHIGPYVEAWTLSLIVSAVAVGSLVFAPWLLFWSYLVILFAFNHVVVRRPTPKVRERFRNSRWLPVAPAFETGTADDVVGEQDDSRPGRPPAHS